MLRLHGLLQQLLFPQNFPAKREKYISMYTQLPHREKERERNINVKKTNDGVVRAALGKKKQKKKRRGAAKFRADAHLREAAAAAGGNSKGPSLSLTGRRKNFHKNARGIFALFAFGSLILSLSACTFTSDGIIK